MHPDPEIPFALEVSPADERGRRECVARGPDGEHRDKFDPADAFRREKFLKRAVQVGMLPTDSLTERTVSVHFWACVREADAGPAAPEARPRLVTRCAADIAPRSIEWLWPGRLPLGALAMLAGDPGLSKSTLALDVAARVTTGRDWPDGRPGGAPGGVLVLSAEDDAAATIVPRLIAHGADLSRVELVEGVGVAATDKAGVERSLSLSLDLDLIRTHLDTRNDWRLIVVDPISAYTQGVDTHRNAEVRSLLAPLAAAASERGLAVLAVTHLNKAQGGPAVYRTMGSLAFVAAARVAHLVTRDPDDADRRLLLPVKNNLAPDNDGMAYRVESSELEGAEGVGRLAWEPDPIRLTADELASRQSNESQSGGALRRPSRIDQAEAWLRTALADGPRPSRELQGDASTDEGFGPNTLRSAAQRLGVIIERYGPGKPFTWRLPEPDGSKLHSLHPSPERVDLVKCEPPEPAQATGSIECQHEWTERPSAHEGYVTVSCQHCGESLGDTPAAA